MTDPKRTNVQPIFALSLIHFVGDFYMSFINPLLPVFVEKFSLSLAQAGLINGMMRFLAFIVQPGVGYFADRYRSRIFILGGPLLSIVFISAVGWAHSYWELLLFIAIGAIGASMFHPSMAGMIAGYAGRHVGLVLSIFNMGGTFAFGIGPLFIAWLVSGWGLGTVPWMTIPGVALLLLLWRMTPRPLGEGLRGQGFFSAVRVAFGNTWKPVLLIWVVMVLRTFVQQSFQTFIPILYARQGRSLIEIGLVLSIFTMAGTAGGLLCGHLSDRIGYKPIYYVSFGLVGPAFLLMLLLPGKWIYAASALAGVLMYATLPLGLVMAQKLAPHGKSMVSSLMMGLAQGVGGMMTPLVGSLADLYSIRTVLYVLAFVPLLCLGLVWFFPEKRLREQSLVG